MNRFATAIRASGHGVYQSMDVLFTRPEISAADGQRGPHRRHGQHNVQVVAALVHKVGPASVRSHPPQLRHLVANTATKLIPLAVIEQSRHHARREDVVDELDKALLPAGRGCR